MVNKFTFNFLKFDKILFYALKNVNWTFNSVDI